MQSSQAWQDLAIGEYLQSLPADDERQFRQAFATEITFEEVTAVLRSQDSHVRSKRYTRILQRLEKTSRPLQRLSDAVDVIAQARSEICLIWGPLRATIMVIKAYVEALDVLLDLLEHIEACLIRFKDYEALFTTSAPLKALLLSYYGELIQFLVRVYQFGKKKSKFWKNITQPLQADLRGAKARIARRIADIDLSALVSEMGHASTERQAQNTFRAEFYRDQKIRTQRKIRRWLCPADFHSELERQESRILSGTCEWLFGEEQFKQWLVWSGSTSSIDTFLLSGKPGCGKSVLAAATVRHLSTSGQIPVIYFLFRSTQENCCTSLSAVRGLLYQLLDVEARVEDSLLPLYQSSGNENAVSLHLLWTVFTTVLDFIPQSFCVLDALDECDDAAILLQRFIDLQNRTPGLKLFVTARPVQTFSSIVAARGVEFQVEPVKVNPDIQKYIAHEVDASPKLTKSGLKKDIIDRLSDGADGMFLWAQLLLDDMNTLPTVRKIRKRLLELPTGLYAVYRQILVGLNDKLKAHQLELTKAILVWVTMAKRPLTVQELTIALAAQESHGSLADDCMMLMPKEEIREVCGPLIEILADGTIRLTHLSVRDFLIRPSDHLEEGDQIVKNLLVNPVEAETEIASTCVTYLSFDDFAAPVPDYNCISHGLIRYAALHWIPHLAASHITADVTQATKSLIQSDQAITWLDTWMWLYTERTGSLFDPDDLVFLNSALKRTLVECEVADIGLILERRLNRKSSVRARVNSKIDLARYLHRQSRYIPALRLSLEILQDAKDHLTLEVVDTWTVWNNVALLLHDLGRLEESEKLSVRVSEERRGILGAESIETLESQMNLAQVYNTQGKLEKSAALNLEVLNTWHTRFGKENPGFMNITNNLALVRVKQGRFEEAERLHLVALEGRRRLLGNEHPDTMASIYNLGVVYLSRNRIEDAANALEESLALRRNVLEKDHIDMVQGLNGVGEVYRLQGRNAEARKVLAEALQVSTSAVEASHPYRATTRSTLSMICFTEAKYYEARALEMQAFQNRNAVFGLKHPETLISVHNIGLIAEKFGSSSVAVKALTEAFVGRLELMGEYHRDTEESLHALERLCSSLLEHGTQGQLPSLCVSILNALKRATGNPQDATSGHSIWTAILAEADRLSSGSLEWELYTNHEGSAGLSFCSFSEDLERLWSLFGKCM